MKKKRVFKFLLTFTVLILISIIFYKIGYNAGIGNQNLVYGTTGFPKNCRALITENLLGYKFKEYSADEALASIDRNCGPNGIIWNER